MSVTRPLATIVRATGPDGRRRLALLALLTIVGGLAEFASLAALLSLLRGWFGTAGASLDGGPLALFAVAILTAGAIRLALLAATERLAFDTGHRILVAVQRRVLARDWLTHVSARASGPVAAVELVDAWLFGALLPWLRAGTATVLSAFIVAGLLWVDPLAATAASLLLGGLFALLWLAIRPALRRAGDAIADGYEERVAAIQENVGALRELILADAREAAAEHFRIIDRRLTRARIQLTVIGSMPRILVESIGLLLLVCLAAWLANRPGGAVAALPTLATLALGAQRLLPLFQAVGQAAGNAAGMRSLSEKVAALIDTPDLRAEPRADPLPFTRELRLDQLGFTYPDRDEPVLDRLDLVIRAGERIALTGRNGSGKSTLADLVMGLLPPTSGRILIDGVDVAPEQLRAWQRNVAHVPQSPFLADASIARNIAFAVAEPDHVRVVEAARLAGLHDLIMALPRGYETRVGDRGQLLSGGQRQRLALARALYAPAPLLVLDEASSALDPETEQHLLRALDALQAGGTTILLIAHRPAMLAGCDRVLRIERGALVPA